MDNKDTKFKLRSKWQAFCEKYQKKGELDGTDCSFSEVNYKFFVKSKLMRSKQRKWRRRYSTRNIAITVSKSINQNNNNKITGNNTFNKTNGQINNLEDTGFIDIKEEDSFRIPTKIFNKSAIRGEKVLKVVLKNNVDKIFTRSFTKHSPTKDSRENVNVSNSVDKENHANVYNRSSLEDLVQFIEVDLNSRLKDVLIYRSECKILESNNYSHWHECAKTEMKRLQKYIRSTELKEYMRYCDKVDTNFKLCDKVTKAKHNLKYLLTKRELVRNDEERYLKYCNKVYVEWQRLSNYIPVDYMILYASRIINSVKEASHNISLSEGQVSRDSVQEIQGDLINFKCITF